MSILSAALRGPDVLMLPDFDRADAIGACWGNPKTRTFGELLIDCEDQVAKYTLTRSRCAAASAGRRQSDLIRQMMYVNPPIGI